MSKAYTLYVRNKVDAEAIEDFLNLSPNIRAEKKEANYPWTLQEVYEKLLKRLYNRENGGARVVFTSISDGGEYCLVILKADKTTYKFGKAKLRDGEEYDSRIGYGLAVARALDWKDLEQLFLETIEREERKTK